MTDLENLIAATEHLDNWRQNMGRDPDLMLDTATVVQAAQSYAALEPLLRELCEAKAKADDINLNSFTAGDYRIVVNKLTTRIKEILEGAP